MTITTDHWLKGSTRSLISGGDNMGTRRLLVIHFTNGGHAPDTIADMKRRGLSIHLMIDRDGTTYQCRPFNRTCAHAGISKWRDPGTGDLYRNVNTCSVGIELCNAGAVESVRKKYSTLPATRAKPLDGTAIRNWETFTAAQLAACTEAAKAIVKRYNLDDVTGHYWIAPNRRDDPGPAFPMKALREACGFTGLPVIA
jgi:N-acetylmuramoyl-L-alanine amidase